jgi:hypothetical protein
MSMLFKELMMAAVMVAIIVWVGNTYNDVATGVYRTRMHLENVGKNLRTEWEDNK